MKSSSPWPCVAASLLFSTVSFAQAAGSDADARALEIGRAYIRLQEQLRTLATAPDTTPWWRAPIGTYTPLNTRDKVAQANREFYDAVRGPLGKEPKPATGRDWRYDFLPEAKQLVVAQIDQGYNDKLADLRRDSPYLRLPSDTEKIKQVLAAREKELLTILTKDEFETLDLRTSPSTATIRQRFGEAIESEDELRKVFVLQRAFDETHSIEEAYFSTRSQEAMRQRNEAERKLMEDIRAAVGDERYVRYRRFMDQDFQSLRAVARRFNLAETAIDEALKIRENYSTQSLTINGETSLNSMDRRALIQDLAKDARKELSTVLTPPGLEFYASRVQWVRYLEQGTAFSLNPKDSPSGLGSVTQSTFMVLPGGVTATTVSSGGTISVSTSTTTPSPSGSTTARRLRPTTTPASSKEKSSDKPSADPAPVPPSKP